MSHERKLTEMGYRIEPAELRLGKLLQAVKVNNFVYTSGQVPIWGEKTIKGKIGKDLTLEDGYEAAKLCALNGLRAIKAVTGSLDEIVRFVKVFGMVNVDENFNDTSKVINGCTDLLCEVFGEAGSHARSAVGMTIPLNFAVEIEMIVVVK